MRYSIRYRFTIILVGMTALVLLATWGINNWWLERYYTAEKVRSLEYAYEQINREVIKRMAAFEAGENSEEAEGTGFDETTPLSQSLLEFSEKNNVAILLLDSNTGLALFSSARDREFLAGKVQRYVFGKDIENSETLRKYDNYFIQKNYDTRSKSYYLESWGYFSDNTTLFIMSTPLTSIRESVVLSNRFFGLVALSALLCGSILMSFTTRKITSPILSLAKISERMSHLDFEARYTGKEQDEIGILGNSMNVLSEKLKETIGALQQANTQLQKDIDEKIQIDELRKEFIANVSHELKTPIALIQGYAEGLSEGMAEDSVSRDYYCEVIMDEASKMNQMVRQLLNLTALEFGNDEPNVEIFDIAEMIHGVINSVKILTQQRNIKLEFCCQDNHEVWVKADEFKIEEVVTNYLSNALNHVDDTGDEPGQIKIQIYSEQDKVKVTVFNTGSWIPEGDIPNLWTKFYKVDKARTREYGGSGIGLSIVKAIIEAHHQTCGVENVQGGVAFWFTLEKASRGV